MNLDLMRAECKACEGSKRWPDPQCALSARAEMTAVITRAGSFGPYGSAERSGLYPSARRACSRRLTATPYRAESPIAVALARAST